MKYGVRSKILQYVRLAVAGSTLVLLLFWHIGMAQAAGATLYIDPTSSGVTGDTISANVRLNTDIHQVRFTQFGLSYDTNKLQFLAIENAGTSFSDLRSGGGNGSMTVYAGSMNDRVNGDVLVVGFKFKILSQSGTTALNFNNPIAYNENLQNVISSTAGATYELGSVSVPTNTPTGTTRVIPERGTTVGGPSSVPTQATQSRATNTIERTSSPAPTVLSTDNSQPPTTEATNTSAAFISSTPLWDTSGAAGSVFLKPPKSSARINLGIIMQPLSYSWAAASLSAVLLVCAAELKRSIRYLLVWYRKRDYEIIPPLRLLSKSSNTFYVSNMYGDADEIPYIPITKPQPLAADSVQRPTYDWELDLNSPLANTL